MVGTLVVRNRIGQKRTALAEVFEQEGDDTDVAVIRFLAEETDELIDRSVVNQAIDEVGEPIGDD